MSNLIRLSDVRHAALWRDLSALGVVQLSIRAPGAALVLGYEPDTPAVITWDAAGEPVDLPLELAQMAIPNT